ncbi:MAG: hypothetical protein ACFE8Z_10040 [Candidatus Hermodarchaeota archaeon]
MYESVPLASTGRFDPPDEGMLPGESIVWTRRAGTDFWIIFLGALFAMGAPLLTFLSFDANELLLGSMFGFLTIVGFVGLGAILVRVRRTRYYLTTDRIVEARGGKIIRVVPLDHFAGKPLGQFIESRVTHSSNGHPVYGIRIYDPVSDEVIELKGLDPTSARAFERIGEVVECPYCGFNNTAIRSQCKNCDAVM